MLLDAEIARIKFELGYNLLEVGAVPWIGVTQIFEQIIQPYMGSGAATTSATTVTAASTPTPVTLTLASGTGFASGQRVVIDVDDRQEVVTARIVTGAALTADLSLTHSGTYPVTVEGGEVIVRECLRNIRNCKTRMGSTFGAGALKKVDEVEWYNSSSQSTFGGLGQELMTWRDELAAACGDVGLNLWRRRQQGGSRVSVY